MNTRIYFFTFDTDSGMGTRLHLTEAHLLEEIHQCVATEAPDLIIQMRALPFASADWRHLWEQFITRSETSCNYYNYGHQDLPLPPFNVQC